MKLIVCLDDKNGMAFNRRRQSADRVVTEEIRTLCGPAPLWTDAYTAKLFADAPPADLRVSEDPLHQAGAGEYCFLETAPVTDGAGAEEIIVFRWNRVYPRDRVFDLELSRRTCTQTREFPGHSHERITMEVYE